MSARLRFLFAWLAPVMLYVAGLGVQANYRAGFFVNFAWLWFALAWLGFMAWKPPEKPWREIVKTKTASGADLIIRVQGHASPELIEKIRGDYKPGTAS